MKKDDEGYQLVEVGLLAIGTPTAATGRVYLDSSTLADEVQRFNETPRGVELGTPERHGQMTDDEWYRRVMQVDESNVCGRIAGVRRVEKDGVVMLVGDFKTDGPHAKRAQELLESEKAHFGLRSMCSVNTLTDPPSHDIKNIVTWDLVPKE